MKRSRVVIECEPASPELPFPEEKPTIVKTEPESPPPAQITSPDSAIGSSQTTVSPTQTSPTQSVAAAAPSAPSMVGDPQLPTSLPPAAFPPYTPTFATLPNPSNSIPDYIQNVRIASDITSSIQQRRISVPRLGYRITEYHISHLINTISMLCSVTITTPIPDCYIAPSLAMVLTQCRHSMLETAMDRTRQIRQILFTGVHPTLFPDGHNLIVFTNSETEDASASITQQVGAAHL